MVMMYFFRLLCFMCVYYASCGTAEELVLRPEHGIAFEKVGLLDNDMTIWHQTFIIPIPRAEIPITRSAMLESSRQGTYWLNPQETKARMVTFPGKCGQNSVWCSY
jgi:hypothetical protein